MGEHGELTDALSLSQPTLLTVFIDPFDSLH
ncbi:MAG: hypothetical protein FD168_1516 [Desulfobulbaceae bacterium]|nr:MAG: hypothetical protein FD168_1516 [Desulfobulbaceae bacterium]